MGRIFFGNRYSYYVCLECQGMSAREICRTSSAVVMVAVAQCACSACCVYFCIVYYLCRAVIGAARIQIYSLVTLTGSLSLSLVFVRLCVVSPQRQRLLATTTTNDYDSDTLSHCR